MRHFWILSLAGILILTGCEDNKRHDSHDDVIKEIHEDTVNHTSKEVEQILKSIPSHSEITATIKASGAPYSGLVVNNPVNADSYTTNYRKAINLGIYGTDLGYMGIYEQSVALPAHLQVINQLASDINLDHLLRTDDINKMIDDGRLTDSVFAVSAGVFDEMCRYLESNERHETSILMAVGGWLEAIHIATSVAYNSEINNPNLSAKIAEQKLVLNKFITVVSMYQEEPLFKQLLVDLTNLKKLFNEVEFVEPTANADTTIITVPTSPAMITDVQLAQITIELTKIRRSIIDPA